MIVIDSEFQSLIPPLSDDEYDRLEKSLIKNGYQEWREPILTWNGTIIDGHNRYAICDEYGIPFRQVEHEFESRDAAKLYIIDNQLKRRNLPPAAIGDLKLEEKEIVARQAKERQGKRTDLAQANIPPNLGEGGHDGETLEILARDIPMGRESLRKLDVIKQKAKEGDPVAIREREALISGKKKSIHGAYVAVVGKQKPRSQEETTAPDGRKICAMCGEPINEGEAHPARPTVHKKCEHEYQLDWQREKRAADQDADSDLRNNVAVYTIDSLKAELLASAESMKAAIKESIAINESMGVQLTAKQKKDLSASVAHVIRTINKI